MANKVFLYFEVETESIYSVMANKHLCNYEPCSAR